ncbi:hypothetical protein ['Camptotheca acuminata' phytoplasma]|uniref:hypothetical protein n=1 Tax='Camptotheca acuminata' phytoplasma TaxID=3239192 RepID=UPI00351A315A
MGLFETSKGNIQPTQLEKIETNKNAQNSENIKRDIQKAKGERSNIIELIEQTEKELKTNNISFKNQIKVFEEQKENNIRQYTRNATENENLMELEGIYNEAKNNLAKKNIEKLTKEK